MLNWRRGVLAILGVIFFLLIIAGMVLNTIFLVREIRRNEQHDSFINAVTHELKTPVASIRLYLQTLQTRELDEAKRREFYRIMLEDSDRLLHTIEQVLRAGSIALAAAARIARTRINLAELVARVRRARPHALPARRPTRCRTQRRDDGRAVVIGDAEELKTAVWNLIDNAIKYSPTERRMSRRCSRTPEDARLAVRVTRQRRRDFAGRAEARVPPLLSRADAGRRPRRRAAASGCSSSARSRGGTAAGLRGERGRRPRQHLHAPPAQGRTGMTAPPPLLIVEDEHHLAEGLRFNLEAEGYEADVVETGEAALERLLGAERQRYDVVVLDVMLPGKDGFAVVAELRRPRQFVPVLMLTARGPRGRRPERIRRRRRRLPAKANASSPSCSPAIRGLLRRSGWMRRRRPATATPSPARRSTSTRWSCASAIARCR